MAIDPVCGMQVDAQGAAHRSMFDARLWYFCSAGCKQKFDADPSRYIDKPALGDAAPAMPAQHHTHAHAHGGHGAAAPASAGTLYTCPMHPEIERSAPGDCPKCGMALVPIAGTGSGETDDSELRDLTRRMWIGVVLSIPLVILAMSPMASTICSACSRAHAAGSSLCWVHRWCCGSAGRSCASSGSRSYIANSTCTR